MNPEYLQKVRFHAMRSALAALAKNLNAAMALLKADEVQYITNVYLSLQSG